MSKSKGPATFALTATRTNLLAFLSEAARTASNGKPIPVLASAYLQALGGLDPAAGHQWWATDGEIWRGGRLKAETVTTPGETLLPVAHLYALVKQCADGLINLAVRERANGGSGYGTLHITAGAFKAELPLFPLEDFPHRPTDLEGGTMMPAAALAKALRMVLGTVNESGSQYFTRGVKFESTAEAIVAVGTDGHRLAKAVLEQTKDTVALEFETILPKRTCSELVALLGDCDAAELVRHHATEDHKHVFAIGSDVVISREIDDKFPNYARVIPQAPTTLAECDREALLRAVQRVSLVMDGNSKGARFIVAGSSVQVAANSPDKGIAEDELVASVTGPDIEICLNPAYVREALEAMAAESLVIELTNSVSAVLFRPAGEPGLDYVHVIMAMRL